MYEREVEDYRPPNENSIANLKVKRTKNKLSKKSDRKLRSAINWLAHSARDKKVFSKKHGYTFNVRLTFITLNVPLCHSQKDVRTVKEEVLQPWLSYMRKYHAFNNYIWRSERGKKGHIHFHFTCDTVVAHYAIRQAWNRQMQRGGYLKEFFEKHRHNDPNSIDVHSVRKINNLAAELAKYMSKSDMQGQMIEGRLWGCSFDLSKATNATARIERGSYEYNTMGNWASRMKTKAIELMSKKHGRMIQVATLFFPTPKDWIHQKMGDITRVYNEVMWLLQTGHECLPLYVIDTEN